MYILEIPGGGGGIQTHPHPTPSRYAPAVSNKSLINFLYNVFYVFRREYRCIQVCIFKEIIICLYENTEVCSQQDAFLQHQIRTWHQ